MVVRDSEKASEIDLTSSIWVFEFWGILILHFLPSCTQRQSGHKYWKYHKNLRKPIWWIATSNIRNLVETRVFQVWCIKSADSPTYGFSVYRPCKFTMETEDNVKVFPICEIFTFTVLDFGSKTPPATTPSHEVLRSGPLPAVALRRLRAQRALPKSPMARWQAWAEGHRALGHCLCSGSREGYNVNWCKLSTNW